MIIGIGTDLIEIDRVIRACEREVFLNRVFTDAEKDLIRLDHRKAADNFAVKEAVSKMLGTGFREVTPIDIEVLRDKLGKPYVKLHGRTKELADKLHITKVHVTISNTKDFSTAFVVGESLETLK